MQNYRQTMMMMSRKLAAAEETEVTHTDTYPNITPMMRSIIKNINCRMRVWELCRMILIIDILVLTVGTRASNEKSNQSK